MRTPWNPPVVSVMSEDGFEQGQPLPISSDAFNTTHEIFAASSSFGTVDDPALQSGADNISITWNYRTSPLGCKFRGTIQSTQSTIASGEFSVNAFDTDTDYTTNGLIGWDPSVKLPLGFSINLSVFKPLLGYVFKQTEALAASTYAFDSPDLGQINPDTQRLEETSSKRSHWGSDYDADVQKNTALSPQPKIVAKGYGTDMDSKAIWQWFYKLDAISEPDTPIDDDGILTEVSNYGKARARGTVIIMTNCANVRYVK